MEKKYTITLNAFLRRTLKAYALKAYIRQQGCELKRIGRSRDWLLTANIEQLHAVIEFINSSSEPSWAWVVKRLANEYKKLNHDELLKIAASLKNVTISALIARSGCTIAQARKIIDELEALD